MSLSNWVDLVGMAVCPAELSAVVRQDAPHNLISILVERQNVFVQQGDGALRELPGMNESKGVRAVGIHLCLHVDQANSLQPGYIERVLKQLLSRPAALDMPLPKARIGFLYLSHLVDRELDPFYQMTFFEPH